MWGTLSGRTTSSTPSSSGASTSQKSRTLARHGASAGPCSLCRGAYRGSAPPLRAAARCLCRRRLQVMGLEANRRRPVTRAVSCRCAGFQNIHESVRALPGVDMSDAQIRDVRVAGSLRRARAHSHSAPSASLHGAVCACSKQATLVCCFLFILMMSPPPPVDAAPLCTLFSCCERVYGRGAEAAPVVGVALGDLNDARARTQIHRRFVGRGEPRQAF